MINKPPVGLSRRTIRDVEFRLKPLETMCAELAPVYRLWQDKRGGHPYPPKDAIAPREIKDHLKNILLLRVLDEGQDFEMRIVGDVLIQTYGSNFQGKRASAFVHFAPLMDMAHRPVVADGAPRLVWYRIDFSDHPVYCRETLVLPLGSGGRAVDHLMAVGVHRPEES